MPRKPKPELFDRYVEKERKSRKEEDVAKPQGIERKGSKYKVFLEYEDKRIHIGYYKTLDDAKEALETAKKDAGLDA